MNFNKWVVILIAAMFALFVAPMAFAETVQSVTAQPVPNTDYGAVLDKVAGYMGRFVDAALPIAKQAYEIGLLTLQIDAAAVIVPLILLLIGAVFVVCHVGQAIKAAQAKAARTNEQLNLSGYYARGISNFLPADGVLHVFVFLVSACLSFVALYHLLNVWLWVKLVKPELWLAHQAIEKLIR